jgi:hypothetical protein
VHLDKALGVPGGLEPPHPFLPLTRRLVRVLGPIIQVSMLSMGNAGHDDAFRGRIASQLIRNDHAWSAP